MIPDQGFALVSSLENLAEEALALYRARVAFVNNHEFASFKGYLTARFPVHVLLRFEGEPDMCFCRDWLKGQNRDNSSKICEHVVGLQFVQAKGAEEKKKVIQMHCRAVPLGKKPKRG